MHKIALIFVLLLCHLGIECQTLYLQNIPYIHVQTGTTKQANITIENGKISAIKKRGKAPKNAKIIDGSQLYLIPGLVDAHIHLFQSGGIYTRPDAVDLRQFKSYKTERQWLKDNTEDLLKRYLKIGITSVIDMGGPLYQLEKRKALQNASSLPNLVITGPLVSTYLPPQLEVEDAPIVKVKSKEEAIALVRKQLPFQPDFIKIWYIALPTQTAESTYDIVAATIAEAHNNGLKAAVHATQLNTAKLALKAGADILVHSVDDPIDEDFIQLMKTNQATYIPTMQVHGNYIEMLRDSIAFSKADFSISNPTPLGSFFDTKGLPKGNDYENSQQYLGYMELELAEQEKNRAANLKKLASAGVSIATGTDAGNIKTLHASSYYKELNYMQKAGLTNAEILRASTQNAASIFDKTSNSGSIEIGKDADLVLLNANPLTDLKALQDIAFVIKNGLIMSPDTIHQSTPKQLAQQQLNGYNARDIDAFLAPYAEDVEIYRFPNELLYTGKEKMRQNYGKMFDNTPDLYCKLVNRMVQGNTVIDQELVYGRGDKPFEAIAIYKIDNSKIQQVYFIQ